MEQKSINKERESRVCWETLEAWSRRKLQEFLQGVLQEELSEFIGRGKSERRPAVDSPAVYRNGYGKPRKLTLSCGTVTVRRPRVRGWQQEKFESRILPLFARRSPEVNQLIPELYLHGLAEGDFDMARFGVCLEKKRRLQREQSLG